MIDEIRDVRWALLVDEPAHNAGMELSNTHPQVWGVLGRTFEPVPVPWLPTTYHLLRRRNP